MTRKLDFTDVHLYGVTTSTKNVDFILSQAEKMLQGGVDCIQLRNKELKDKALLDFGQKLKNLCHQHDALFIINNRPDLAILLDADGVHLGHEDMPIEKARSLIGHRKIIGASTHSLPQAIQAQRAGADYVSCGPIWATPTKPDYNAVGVNLIGLYHAALHIPFIVIGGVDTSNIQDVVKMNANRVAVVRALFEADDPKQVAQYLRTQLLTGNLVSK